MALHVHQALWPQIEAEPGLLDVYRRIEMPTSLVLGRIERTGVLIDSALLAAQGQELAERMYAMPTGVAGFLRLARARFARRARP